MAATAAPSSPQNRIRVNLNLSTSRPGGTPSSSPKGAATGSASAAASSSEPPTLEREDSFDLSTLRKFNKLFSEGKVDEAVKLMSEDVKWYAFDGRVIEGRAGCQKLFEEQRQLGLKRKPLTEWILQVKGPEDDQDSASFTAQRIMQYEKPQGVPARLVQTMTVKRGQITQSVVEAAGWEPDLEPLELLLRFGSLRAAQKNDQAVDFLDASCEWRRLDMPEIFTPSAELSDPVIKGPDMIKKLWDEQKKQDVTRTLLTNWEEADPKILTGSTSDAGGQVFSRQIEVSGKGGAAPKLWTQIARVVEGRITEIAHAAAEEMGTKRSI